MDAMNFDDAQTLVSPVRSSNEGSRTPLSNATRTLASIPSSSPITSRPRQGSVSRKRTNEESWGPVEAPQTSPKSARPLRRSVTIASIPEMDQQSRSIPIEKGNETSQTQPSAATDLSPAHGNSFDKEIYEYKQQLELDYQTFEQSLNERDAAADLNVIDWEDLEARYIQEISPCIDREREIMNEFNTRFAQFLLYMQVSNDHETERAVKRLRTRVAVAQNSEGLLAQKQAHHEKVLQAFHSAMDLLGNV